MAKQAAEKLVCLKKVATGTLSGALKRSFPRINAGLPPKRLRPASRVRAFPSFVVVPAVPR